MPHKRDEEKGEKFSGGKEHMKLTKQNHAGCWIVIAFVSFNLASCGKPNLIKSEFTDLVLTMYENWEPISDLIKDWVQEDIKLNDEEKDIIYSALKRSKFDRLEYDIKKIENESLLTINYVGWIVLTWFPLEGNDGDIKEPLVALTLFFVHDIKRFWCKPPYINIL